MNTKLEFHGSDLEKISIYYGIPQDSIVNFGANVNPLGLSEHIKTQISSHLDVLSSYPDREYTELRNSISVYCGVSPGHILVGNGSTELISLLIEQRAPKKALILGPTYSEYSRELSFSDCIQEYYHLDSDRRFRLDICDFLMKLEEQYDLLIICNPNNPTSSAICHDELLQILNRCRELDTFVMIDETYVEFALDIALVTAMSLVDEFDNFMVLRGVSKFFAAPGLRLGYGVTSNLAFLAQAKEHQIPWSLNSIGAFAGERMLKDTVYIEKTRSLILKERHRILKELKTFENVTAYEAEANFILLQLHKEGLSAHMVFDACIKKGLMIRDCSSFQCLDGEYVRFCIMKPEDNTRLLKALKESCC